MSQILETETERYSRRAGLTHLRNKRIFGKAHTYRRPTSPSNTSHVRMDLQRAGGSSQPVFFSPLPEV